MIENKEEKGLYAGLFLVFVLVTILIGVALDLSGVLNRAELQTIDRRFEARRWIDWTPEALKRLNPAKLMQYHDAHEIPRKWWAWDYTLSWLLEPNHISVKHKIIMFNHLLEDEPPAEALEGHPWLKPLMQFPVSRETTAKAVEFLARSGVKAIILDNDFPQFSPGDAVLARSLHACSSGELTGRKIPILMASTVNHRSFANVLQLDVSTGPAGILKVLQELEPGADVQDRYTGTTSMILDEDQVVRRAACRVPDPNMHFRDSLTLKVLSRLGEKTPSDLPTEMDIDFAGPPNSELYPVRPFTYLLDPELQKRITNAQPDSDDVSLKDAIVILGDGVTDLYPTPFTNLGVNLMSGPEILAQTIDTIARHSWHYRLDAWMRNLYLLASALIGGGTLCLWKRFYSSKLTPRQRSFARPCLDLFFCIAIVGLSYTAACILFCKAMLIVPVLVPAVSIMVASLATALWEQENERARSLKQQLKFAEERLVLQEEKYAEELRRKTAEAQAQEVMQDEKRRKEFVRKINHDLKAPVTVMSWILVKLKQGGLSPEVVSEKIEKLAKTSNRLVDLLHELARSYETAKNNNDDTSEIGPCQLNRILPDCVSMAGPLAEMKGSKVTHNVPERILWVTGNPLQISRVFDNLIRNALIHNPGGTAVHVEARSRAHVHQISISDNGVGIEKDKLEKLMQPDPDKICQSVDGKGMGLQIIISLIESMGGKLSVESESGLGTTFTVALPSSHLEAGGDSGDDILSTGQYQLVQLARAAALTGKSKGE